MERVGAGLMMAVPGALGLIFAPWTSFQVLGGVWLIFGAIFAGLELRDYLKSPIWYRKFEMRFEPKLEEVFTLSCQWGHGTTNWRFRVAQEDWGVTALPVELLDEELNRLTDPFTALMVRTEIEDFIADNFSVEANLGAVVQA